MRLPSEKPRAPVTLYLLVGVLAVFGALALIRWLLSAVFSLLTIVALAALVVFVVGRLRRGRRS